MSKIDSVWVSRCTIGNFNETHAGLSTYVTHALERVIISGWDKHAALVELENRLLQVLADVKTMQANVLDESILEGLVG